MIVKRLRDAMAEKKMRQKELAEKLGISAASVSQWLSGRSKPNKVTMERLAEILDVNLEEFIEVDRKAEKITVERAAKLMGTSPQFVRIGLQKGELPFGHALKMNGNRYTYYISLKKLNNYIGEDFSSSSN